MIIEVEKGMALASAVEKVKKSLNGKGYHTLIFNDIHITVNHDSNIEDICSIYYLQHKLKQLS